MWYTLNLGDAMLAGEAVEHIRDIFQARHAPNAGAKELAVFIRHESEGRLHCQVVAYFTPDAAEIAKELGAYPCLQPAADGLSLLAGCARLRPGEANI